MEGGGGDYEESRFCVCAHIVHLVESHVTLRSPGYGRYSSAVLVDEVAPSVEHPAVVEGHEGVSGCGGRVFSLLSVGILQRGELVLPEHFVHDKGPETKHSHKTLEKSLLRFCFLKLEV